MKILILLSTYNGEAFLAEQLDSLYAQESVELHILVRDDGSKDKTLQILDGFSKVHGRMTIVRGHNVGAGPSFLSLICEASTNYRGFDYYAFCDQDDVWLPHKLYTEACELEKSNNPLKLCYSGAINTDADLHLISDSCVKSINSFGANLVSNHILGCTMLFNEELLLQINRINTFPFSIPNGKIPIHDSWTAFVAYSLNADVVFVKEKLMYYRQHSCNVIGASSGFFPLWKNRIKRYLKGCTYVKSNRCIIALQVLGEMIPSPNRQLLELVANYRYSIKSKMRLLFDSRMYKYGLLDNFGTFLTLLFNKF